MRRLMAVILFALILGACLVGCSDSDQKSNSRTMALAESLISQQKYSFEDLEWFCSPSDVRTREGMKNIKAETLPEDGMSRLIENNVAIKGMSQNATVIYNFYEQHLFSGSYTFVYSSEEAYQKDFDALCEQLREILPQNELFDESLTSKNYPDIFGTQTVIQWRDSDDNSILFYPAAQADGDGVSKKALQIEVGLSKNSPLYQTLSSS